MPSDSPFDASKGVFPYEALTTDNYMEVLSRSEPFEHREFHSSLKRGNLLSMVDYQKYVEDARGFENRWENLKRYNIQDTVIMINPILNLIDMFAEKYIDMLHGISLASNAAAMKFMGCFFPSLFNSSLSPAHDFDINKNYTIESKEKEFELTREK